MKKLIFLVSFALALVLLLSSCSADVPPDGDTTPSSSAPDIAPSDVTTTVSGATDTPNTPSDMVVRTGRVSSTFDDVDVTKIKIEIYEIITPELAVDPDPRYIRPYNYNPELEEKYQREHAGISNYITTVSPDADGSYSFKAPDSSDILKQVDVDSLPAGYGYRASGDNYVIDRVENVECRIGVRSSRFVLTVVPHNAAGEALQARYSISEARFSDSFVDDMLNGNTATYSTKVTIGDRTFGVECSYDMNYPYWEWRVAYLYYNSYITLEQFEEIHRTRKPSEVLPVM